MNYETQLKKMAQYRVLLAKLEKTRDEIYASCQSAGIDCGVNYIFPGLIPKIKQKIIYLRKRISEGH